VEDVGGLPARAVSVGPGAGYWVGAGSCGEPGGQRGGAVRGQSAAAGGCLRARRQGLTLVRFSAQPEPFLT